MLNHSQIHKKRLHDAGAQQQCLQKKKKLLPLVKSLIGFSANKFKRFGCRLSSKRDFYLIDNSLTAFVPKFSNCI